MRNTSKFKRNNYERLGLVFFMQINSFDAKKDRTTINFPLIGFDKETKIITAAQYIKDKQINTKGE